MVGAGPAGSATAALLAEAGHQVLLVDRARFPRTKPCAEYITPGAGDILARLGVLDGLGPRAGCALRGMELHAPNGACYLVEYRTASRPRRSLSMPRAELDATLVAAARARGAEVWEGFRVASLLASEGAVRGVAGYDSAGHARSVRARLVVGADGAHSVVVRSLGLRKPGRWPRRLGLVTHIQGVPWPEDHGQMHVGPRGYVGVAPLGRDMVTLGLVMPMPHGRLGASDAALEAALAEYPALAARLARGKRACAVQGVGPLAHAVRSCAGHGYLLVGDAAGFFDPFTGEGIYRALRGAEIAAQVADGELRAGTEVVSVAREYERARRAVFRAKERLTALIQVFVQVPTLMNYAVERLGQRPKLGILLGNVLGDLEPAGNAMRLGYLWALLRP